MLIDSNHLAINIEPAVVAVLSIFTVLFSKTPKFRVYGGTARENIALQNIQVREILSAFCVQVNFVS